MDPKKELELLIRARTPIIYVRSYEEDRVTNFLEEIVVRINLSGKASFSENLYNNFIQKFSREEKIKEIIRLVTTTSDNKVYIDLSRIPIAQKNVLEDLNTKEEKGCLKELVKYVENSKYLTKWTQDKGLLIKDNNGQLVPVAEAQRVPLGVKYLSNLESRVNVLMVAYDLHLMCHPNEYSIVNRHLKDLARNYRKKSSDFAGWPFNTLVIVSSTYEIPRELEKDIEVVDFPPPFSNELESILTQQIGNFSTHQDEGLKNRANELSKDKELLSLLCRAGQGLIGTEFELAVNKMMFSGMEIGNDCADLILIEKQQIIQKNEVLEYFPPIFTHRDVGGLENFMAWLDKREYILKTQAWENEKIGIPMPKGVLIVGASGGGKSLMAKATAGTWKVPLLRLDMGKVFSKYVGEAERRIRDALVLAENMAPCILWLDEIEKGLAGSGGSGDSGVGARVFGSFLTWMQEKEKPVFMIATANSIQLFVDRFPEFLRKGRFDNIFFVGVPNPKERKAILEIYLKKYLGHIVLDQNKISDEQLKGKLNEELQDVLCTTQGQPLPDNLVGLTTRFTGAEIEYFINEIAINAYTSKKTPDYTIDYDNIKEFFKKFTPMYSNKIGPDGKIPRASELLEKARKQVIEYGGIDASKND